MGRVGVGGEGVGGEGGRMTVSEAEGDKVAIREKEGAGSEEAEAGTGSAGRQNPTVSRHPTRQDSVRKLRLQMNGKASDSNMFWSMSAPSG